MRRRLLVTHLVITAVAVLLFAVPLAVNFARVEREHALLRLEREAVAVAILAEDALEQGQVVAADEITARAARAGVRIVVVDGRGRSAFDTGGLAAREFATRPEVAAALTGQRVSGERHSATLGDDLLYAAVPVASGHTVHGAVRVSTDPSDLASAVRRNLLTLAALGVLVLGAIAVVGLALSRSVTEPVAELEAASVALARGDLRRRIDAPTGAPELRRLAGAYNDMAGQLEHVVELQRSFVADASHQLRSPLTALTLRLENLAGTVGPAGARSLEQARAETERLSRLVDQLLDLARVEAAAAPRTTVDAAAVARERVEMWSALAEEHGVALRCVAPAQVVATAVAGALEQMVDNLLANALDAVPAGTEVVVRVGDGGDGAWVEVVDRGPGLTDEERERAFDRFWRGSRAEAGDGSGLGLAIVRQLAASSGGRASLRPTPGGGLTARIELAPAGADQSTAG